MNDIPQGRHWLIYSREHNAFWRPDSSGYTYDIDAAGRYTEEDAKANCTMRDPQRDGSPSEIAVVAPEAIRQAEAAARKEGHDELEQRLWAVIDPNSVPSDIVDAVHRLAQAYRHQHKPTKLGAEL